MKENKTDTFTQLRAIHSFQNRSLSLDEINTYFNGSYETLPNALQKLLIYAKENDFMPEGTVRHTFPEGPPQHKNPEKFITQVFLPIKNIGSGFAL